MNKTATLVFFAFLCWALCLKDASAQNTEALDEIGAEILNELTGVKETPNIVFHYRPGDVDEKTIAKVIKGNLDRFAECEQLLKMDYKGRIHVCLYRDMEDLQKTTGVDAAAFATGKVSVHQPMDFDSVHELVHIFALQFPKDKDETTDMFVVEGLATILAGTDEGIPIHSWVSVFKSAGKLPELIPFRKTWPDGAPRGVHAYYPPASFMGFLIDQYGIEKVKLWYVNSTEAHMAFGKTFRRLESEWHDWLSNQTVEPEHRVHILKKIGLLPVPESFVTAEGISLFDGKSMKNLKAEDSTAWNVKDGLLIGKNPKGWTLLHTERTFDANIGVRMKFRLVEGNAIQVRLNRTDESNNHVNLATWAMYMSQKKGDYYPGWDDLKITLGEWSELVYVNENGTGRLYVNGFLAIESKDQFDSQKGTIGLGLDSGTIEVETFEAFEF